MLFIASAGENGLVVADLSEFRRAMTIPLGNPPRQVFRVGSAVFATCPDSRTLFAVNAAAVSPNESVIGVATDRPAALHLVDPKTRRIVRTRSLSTPPIGLSLSDDLAAVTTATTVVRISLSGQSAGTTDLGLKPGILHLHQDAHLILLGAADRNQIVTVDARTGALLARLPLAFTPARFCLNADGGQLFVTGTAGDEIAIVSPYQSEVDQTIVAGRTPWGMAVGTRNGQNLLFVTNPGSGDLTIFDIDTRQHASSVHIGGRPGEVLLTPDGEYALTVDQDSGDVAVIRISVVIERKSNTGPAPLAKPLFTIFPTGAGPQAAAIVPRA
jgi:DNA-binding beta-propeller fold protein YncE